jgi:hypothetical protein
MSTPTKTIYQLVAEAQDHGYTLGVRDTMDLVTEMLEENAEHWKLLAKIRQRVLFHLETDGEA